MTRDDGTTEHKPMTDAELARLERAYSAENWADSDGPVEARNARALIAEVRRLREEIAYLTRGHDWANAMRVVVDSGTLDADQLERLREHFEKWLRDPEPFSCQHSLPIRNRMSPAQCCFGHGCRREYVSRARDCGDGRRDQG